MKVNFITTILFIGLSLISCRSEDKQDQATVTNSDTTVTAADTSNDAELRIFEGTGKVISIPPSKRNFIVKHGDIPGFMNAMTMAFPVKDTTLLQDISPQDSIKFVIEQQGRETFITDINIIE